MNSVLMTMLEKYEIKNAEDETNAIREINYKDAKEDVLPFIEDVASLDLWSEEFFKEISKML